MGSGRRAGRYNAAIVSTGAEVSRNRRDGEREAGGRSDGSACRGHLHQFPLDRQPLRAANKQPLMQMVRSITAKE